MRDPWALQRWAFGQVTGNPVRKGVLSMLAMMGDAETGKCEAKVPTIAAGVEVSERSVQTHLTALQKAGIIARRPQYRRDGSQRGNEYLLLAPWVSEWPDGEGVDVVRGGGERGSPWGEAGCTGGVNVASGQELPLGNDHKTVGAKAPPASSTARAKEVLPEGFPDDLRPHLTAAYRVLRDLSQRVEAREVKAVALASVVMARPRKPLVRAAHDFAAWADGRAKPPRDVVASYRNWLDREDDLAVSERLGSDGLPAGRMNGQTNGYHANGRPVGLLERQVWPDGRTWPELTRAEQENAKESVSMNGRPWEARVDQVAYVNGNGNGGSLTSENFLDG